MPNYDLCDLDNPAAPPLSTLVTISVPAFKKWMKALNYVEATANVNQEVFFIWRGATITAGGHQMTPNWHITAMTTQRDGGDCRNFHFKAELGKAASHYWHYVVHRTATGGYVWVGDPNPLILTTNEGGGGAGSDLVKLNRNRDETEAAARIYGMTRKMSKKLQGRMVTKLGNMIGQGLTYASGRID